MSKIDVGSKKNELMPGEGFIVGELIFHLSAEKLWDLVRRVSIAMESGDETEKADVVIEALRAVGKEEAAEAWEETIREEEEEVVEAREDDFLYPNSVFKVAKLYRLVLEADLEIAGVLFHVEANGEEIGVAIKNVALISFTLRELNLDEAADAWTEHISKLRDSGHDPNGYYKKNPFMTFLRDRQFAGMVNSEVYSRHAELRKGKPADSKSWVMKIDPAAISEAVVEEAAEVVVDPALAQEAERMDIVGDEYRLGLLELDDHSDLLPDKDFNLQKLYLTLIKMGRRDANVLARLLKGTRESASLRGKDCIYYLPYVFGDVLRDTDLYTKWHRFICSSDQHAIKILAAHICGREKVDIESLKDKLPSDLFRLDEIAWEVAESDNEMDTVQDFLSLLEEQRVRYAGIVKSFAESKLKEKIEDIGRRSIETTVFPVLKPDKVDKPVGFWKRLFRRRR